MGDALGKLGGVAGSVLLNQLSELLGGLGGLQSLGEFLGLYLGGLAVLHGGGIVGNEYVICVLGQLGIQLHNLTDYVPGVGSGGGLLTGGGVLGGGGGGDDLGVTLLATLAEEPLDQVGGIGGGGIRPVGGGAGDLVQLGLSGGIDVGADGVGGLLVGVGVGRGEDGLYVLLTQVVQHQNGGQNVSLGLLGGDGGLNVFVGDVGLVQRLELEVYVVLDDGDLNVLGGLALLQTVLGLQLFVDQLVGGVGGGVEGGLVLVAVLLDLGHGGGVRVIVMELLGVLTGDEVVLHSRANGLLGDTVADPVLQVVGEGNAVDLGGLLEGVDVLVDVGGYLGLVLVVETCLLGALAVGQILLSIGVGGCVEGVGAYGGGNHVVGVLSAGGEHLGDAVGVLHQAVLVVHELGVVLVLSNVEAVNVQLVLIDFDVVALGGVVQTANDTDGVNEGVAQDGYDKHEGHDQNQADIGEFALGFDLLLHYGKSFLCIRYFLPQGQLCGFYVAVAYLDSIRSHNMTIIPLLHVLFMNES